MTIAGDQGLGRRRPDVGMVLLMLPTSGGSWKYEASTDPRPTPAPHRQARASLTFVGLQLRRARVEHGPAHLWANREELEHLADERFNARPGATTCRACP